VENLQEVVFQIPLQPFMAFLFWAPSSNHLQSMRTPVSPPLAASRPSLFRKADTHQTTHLAAG